MFDNNVTQSYTQQDATFEIIVMLAGAFILGFILNWLLNKLREETNSQNRHKHQDQDSRDNFSQSGNKQKAKAVSGSTLKPATKNTPRVEDLTKISGISSEIALSLQDEGVRSYSDLRDANQYTLKHLLDSSIAKNISSKEVESWPHQASLAAKGEWDKLNEYQAFIKRSQAASTISSSASFDKNDDLVLIEGIGPKIAEILNKNEIYTFKDVRKTDSPTLKKYIVDADKRFDNHETESWPHQAGMAEQNQWEELRIYQEFMVADNIESNATKDLITNDIEAVNENSSHLKDHDDLKNIEGIETDIEDILNSGGIYTYSQLYNSSYDRIKKLLDNSNQQYDEIDSKSWPHQAGMANRGEWDQLKLYQNFMVKRHNAPTTKTSDDPSSAKKVDANTKDRLQKIEGIGPKIEELLNHSGIYNYKNLKDSSVNFIKKILNDAGPQYRLHNPDTWPTQAQMAFKGQWDKLDKFQEQIVKDRQ